MKHVIVTSKEQPLLAQDGGAVRNIGKALLNGFLFGINPLFLLFIGNKIGDDKDTNGDMTME